MFPFLTNTFSNHNIHLWHTPVEYSPENFAFTTKICEHPSVKIVLVDYEKTYQY